MLRNHLDTFESVTYPVANFPETGRDGVIDSGDLRLTEHPARWSATGAPAWVAKTIYCTKNKIQLDRH